MRLAVLDFSPVDSAAPQGLTSSPRSIGSVKVLRISLTDRCNYRCLYCMPADGVRWLPAGDILSFPEIIDVVRAAVEIHGITRFKLTGGEPTVRPGLVDLVSRLSGIVGVEDLSMTTNGQLLAGLAAPLRDAGLHRLTVSIDSLQPEKFKKITRTGDLAAVLDGLDHAERAGFESLKVNCVTMRGVNGDEIANFARLTLSRRLTVRFIEYMPLGEAQIMGASGPVAGCLGQNRGENSLIPEATVREIIEQEVGPLIPVQRQSEAGVGPANVYRLADPGARGRIGFISAMSQPFCSTCNRLRLTADGLLRSCLFEGGEVDVKPILRNNNASRHRQSALADAMVDCVALKPSVHTQHGNQQMSRIGG